MSTHKSLPEGDVRAEDTFSFGSALATSMSLGFILGMLLENLGLGLACGLGLATLANAYAEKKQGKEHANVALAISIGSLVLLVLIWAFWR